MKKLLYISMLMLLGLSACKRRELFDRVGSVAMVPVHIDWSKSNLKIDDISRVTVRVFPHNGSPAYNFVMQESKTDDVIPLVVGKYSFVIFNETTDPLAVFSIDEFEVTAQMVSHTRTLAIGSPEVTPLTNVVPVPVVKHITIIARVVNLICAKKSSGAITGVVQAVQMSTRKPIGAPINHVFIMNGRLYDNQDSPKDGTIGASIVIFDPTNVENLKADLRLDFLLYDGSAPPTEGFDITSDLKTDKNEFRIAVGGIVDGRSGDRPIVLPAVPTAGGNVGVDDWSEIIVPLK